MISSIFIGVVCIIIQMVIVPQIENANWSMAIMILAYIGYLIAMIIATDIYDKLKSRIKALEDKLNDKEERK